MIVKPRKKDGVCLVVYFLRAKVFGLVFQVYLFSGGLHIRFDRESLLPWRKKPFWVIHINIPCRPLLWLHKIFGKKELTDIYGYCVATGIWIKDEDGSYRSAAA